MWRERSRSPPVFCGFESTLLGILTATLFRLLDLLAVANWPSPGCDPLLCDLIEEFLSASVVTAVMREIMVVHNNALPAVVANMRMTTDDNAADADWTRDDLCVEVDVL